MRPPGRASCDYPFIIRGAGDAAFLRHVSGFIERHQDKFKPNKVDPVRRKWMRMAGDDVDPSIETKKLELIDRFGISGWIPDPTLNDLIGWIADGAAVHPHKDRASDGRMHLRINMLVRKPEGGCVPLLDGIPIEIDLGDAWLCFASECRHATTAVIGQTPRSIISYGLQVDRAAALGLYATYLIWRAAKGGAARFPAS